MDPSVLVRISSLSSLRRAMIATCPSAAANADAANAAHSEKATGTETYSRGVAPCGTVSFDSSGGCALLGTLRVAERAEKYAHHPFHIPAGSLVFTDAACQGFSLHSKGADKSDNGTVDEIRCQALCPQPSWFFSDIRVLLTHWRYITQPPALHGETSAAWAYIEILSSPVLLNKSIQTPKLDRPLSWWLKNQVYPELALEKQFLDRIKAAPPLSAGSAIQILEQHKRSEIKHANVIAYDTEDEEHERKAKRSRRHEDDNSDNKSVIGRVAAVSSLISTSYSDGTVKFLIEIEPTLSEANSTGGNVINKNNSEQSIVLVPVVFNGKQFLGLFASLCIGDSAYVTCLKPAALYTGDNLATIVFTTSASSEAFRIDDFDGLEDSQAYLASPSQLPFTQQSQRSLLALVASSNAIDDISSSTNGAILSEIIASNSTAAVEPSKAGSSLHIVSGDKHLLVNKGKLESYSGKITHVVDFVLGIYVIDDIHLLMLTFWPLLSPLLPLRKGTRVLLENVHVILLANSESYHWTWLDYVTLQSASLADSNTDEQRALVFGACARSSIRIIDFANNSIPSDLPCAFEGSLAAAVVSKTQGLAQMIEAIEAYWKLQKKFPYGPLNDNGEYGRVKGPAIALQTMDMALRLVGVADGRSGERSVQRNLCIEFLSHHKSCHADHVEFSTAARVVTLRQVIERFVGWQKQHEKPSSINPQNEPADIQMFIDKKNDSSKEEVQVVKVYPSGLQLDSIPLIGRIVISERGSIYLQDSSGRIKIQPSFKAKDQSQLIHQSLFPGQQNVGHVYAWKSWCFLIEKMDVVNTLDKNSKLSNLQAMPVTPSFSLVYTPVSDPLLICDDESFGSVNGLSSARVAQKKEQKAKSPVISSDEGFFQYFVFLAHSQTLQIRFAKVKDRGEKDTENEWFVEAVVVGEAFKVDGKLLHQQLHSIDLHKKWDIGTINEDNVFQCILSFRLKKLRALLEPGSAYAICIHNMTNNDNKVRISTGKSNIGSRTVTHVRLSTQDHIHPINITINGPTEGSKCVYGTVGSSSFLRIPELMAYAALNAVFDIVSPPTIYSVSNIHKLCVADNDMQIHAGNSVCVVGIISQRELIKTTTIASADRSHGISSKVAEQTAVAGQFENRIVLEDDTGRNKHDIVLYIKLTSIVHPVGLVPGSRIIVRNAILNVARTTRKAYLSANAGTCIQVVASAVASQYVSSNTFEGCTVDNDKGIAEIQFIGQLYTDRRFQHYRLLLQGCRLDCVSSIRITLVCADCAQLVCNMKCNCADKHHRLPNRSQPTTGTMQASINMMAQISDGSGMALLAISNAEDMCSLLPLAPVDLELLYRAAAHSLDGKLVWKRQRQRSQPSENTQAKEQQLSAESEASSVIRCATAAISKTALLRIEGTLQCAENSAERAAPWSIVKQPVRLGGQSLVVDKYPTATIAAHKVVRITAAEQSWIILENV
ncbi:hypothetical protein GGI25_003386 [Coemansia spiralis]|uniref:CST complex subunit CTC1 n=2 Tax=Coemansia TaxID=4863 RepID=A0A9W8KYF3_9FUNG|nr:hypothetical protein EDC05_003775 [Coemansia umbellata]KAJ2676851.1 hypothetical protein GGI25_003386 [Coemansia spiralis]